MKATILFLFIICFCSLNSCKRDNTDLDPIKEGEKLKATYYLTDKNLGIVFSNTDNSHQLIGFAEVISDSKTKITKVSYRNNSLKVVQNIKVNSDFLLDKVQTLTPESNKEVWFSNYNLLDRKVTIEVVDMSTGTSLFKKEVDLTSEAVNILTSLQTSGKNLANARMAVTGYDCNVLAGGTKTLFASWLCLSGTIGMPIMKAKCDVVNSALPSKLSEWIYPCNNFTEFQKNQQDWCLLKDLFFENEVLDCIPDHKDDDLDNLNFCTENAMRPPKTPAEMWREVSKCDEEFARKSREKENEKKDPAHSTADPHLMTLDGLNYDFQGRGEFIVVKSNTDNFEIQSRQDDILNNGRATFNTAIAVQTGTDVVCFTANPTRLFINKQSQNFASLTSLSLKDGASISKEGSNTLNIITKNGDLVKVVVQSSGYLDYYLYLAENRKGKVIGLLGNYDGNKANDVVVRNGENILQNGSIPFDKLYSTFADSWRITQSNSLFYYDSGKTTDSYTEKNFPRTIAILTAAQKTSAEATCRAAGVSAEPFLSNCIFDVAITNNPAMTASALYGQNADNRITLPVPIVFEAVDVKTINSLRSSSFVLKRDGTLWVSGVNNYGEFGAGQASKFSTNNKFIKIMEGIKEIAKGDGNHMLFLKNDNSVWAAGLNQFGQVGNGTVSNDGVLTAVKIMTDAKDLFVGQLNSFVLKNDNTLWAFGRNYGGQLGNGSSYSLAQSTPVKIMNDVKSVSIGYSNALVLKTDNSLWAFGDNSDGAFGFSKDVKPSSNLPIKIMDNVKGIAVGYGNSLVIKLDNTLWGSGRNLNGVLGTGTTASTSEFKKIMDNVTSVAINYYNTLILKEDNTLWGTGSNAGATLGIGITNDTGKPIQIATDVSYIAMGWGGAFIVKKDNTLWVSGSNNSGELGSGTYNGNIPYGSRSFFQINVK